MPKVTRIEQRKDDAKLEDNKKRKDNFKLLSAKSPSCPKALNKMQKHMHQREQQFQEYQHYMESVVQNLTARLQQHEMNILLRNDEQKRRSDPRHIAYEEEKRSNPPRNNLEHRQLMRKHGF